MILISSGCYATGRQTDEYASLALTLGEPPLASAEDGA
jgi:hypothetical protein